MFICAAGHVTKSGDKREAVAVARRHREYTNDKGKVSSGWEIVREVYFCSEHRPTEEEENA